jgi:magnesium transporter
VIVDNALYRHGERVELGTQPHELQRVHAEATGEHDFVWVGLHEPTKEELEAVAELYGLHALALEDAEKAHQRPKVEHYEGSTFIVLKTLWYVDQTDQVETGEISVFVGEKFVITVRHGEGLSLAGARANLEQMHDVLRHGPSAVVYAVCDQVVDRYAEVADAVQEDVDEVEVSVFSIERTKDAERIYILKRELAEMRRAVMPLREPMTRFANGSVPGIHRDAGPYFRDVSDHLSRVADAIESLDSLLSAAFEAHLAQLALQQNDDMRTITVIVGVVAAPTLIAAIYGMNFEHMPELSWPLGYPLALLLMLLSSTAVFLFARSKNWIGAQAHEHLRRSAPPPTGERG